ncbi:MAG: MerR family transcriptional regulator [Chitinispirillaceae bacterium]
MIARSVMPEIWDVSFLCKVPEHTIGLWESSYPTFLSPVGTRGNQRRYGATQLQAIQLLEHLLWENCRSIKIVQSMIPQDKADRIIDTFNHLYHNQSLPALDPMPKEKAA